MEEKDIQQKLNQRRSEYNRRIVANAERRGYYFYIENAYIQNPEISSSKVASELHNAGLARNIKKDTLRRYVSAGFQDIRQRQVVGGHIEFKVKISKGWVLWYVRLKHFSLGVSDAVEAMKRLYVRQLKRISIDRGVQYNDKTTKKYAFLKVEDVGKLLKVVLYDNRGRTITVPYGAYSDLGE